MVDDSPPEDISSALLLKIAKQGDADDLAIELVKSSVTQPKWFLDDPDRVDALILLILGHYESIFNYLTLDDKETHVQALSQLFQIVFFNNEAKLQKALRKHILIYAKKLQEEINDSDNKNSVAFFKANSRLKNLAAANILATNEMVRIFSKKKNSFFAFLRTYNEEEKSVIGQANMQYKLNDALYLGVKDERERAQIRDSASNLANRLSSK